MRRLVIVMCTLLISSAAFAANVFPTRSADQSRPSKSAALIAARLPTLKAFIAHCEQDFDLQGNPIMVDGLPTFTCWYEMDMPSDGGPAWADSPATATVLAPVVFPITPLRIRVAIIQAIQGTATPALERKG